MKRGIALLLLALPMLAHADPYNQPEASKYSQRDLLKNWAMSACLDFIATDQKARDDADATASAYMEFSKQPIEAFDGLRKLAQQYASKHYGGSIPSDFNTMKCIDLYHSKDLDTLVSKLLKAK
jgi:hypothetical protein